MSLSDYTFREFADRLMDMLESQRQVMEDSNVTRGIDWTRMFENTGGLVSVDTEQIKDAIDNHTAETHRLADAVEALVQLLTPKVQ